MTINETLNFTLVKKKASKNLHALSIIFKDIKKRRYLVNSFSGGSRTAATSKMERFVIMVNNWKPLTIITKCFILDVTAVLDPLLSFTISKLSYCPLIWMFYSRFVEYRINRIHERILQLIYPDNYIYLSNYILLN